MSWMFRRSAIASYVSYAASQRAPVDLSSIAAALGGVLSGHPVSALESATLPQESGALHGYPAAGIDFGRVKLNTLPRPGSLSTQMRPP